MFISETVQNEVRDFVHTLTVETPRDVTGDCQCGAVYRDQCECDYMQLTIGLSADGAEWSYQTGDNSYSGACYFHPYWAVTSIGHDSDRVEVYRDVIDQLFDII